ncbi:MAG: OmpA family protein [Deltaproteobacteria bacterium]|nr:OmpA family protein [Deltaproteobacteria bacterium]
MRKVVFVLLAIAMMPLSSAYAGGLKATKDKVLLRLKVENSQKKPVEGTTVSVRKEKGKRFFSKVTDKDGMLELLVPKGKTYWVKFISLANPDKATVKKIDVPDKPFFKFTLLLIYNPVWVSTFVLRGVYFDTGKARLKPKSYPNLDDLLDFMAARETAEIELSGHTDDVGDDAANLKLSEDRAKSVKKYLVSKGISAKRIVAVGYGETKPVTSNKTPEGRKKNRRTEVKILKK